MTWGQFKELLESRGVADDMVIFYIDCHLPDDGSIAIEIDGDLIYGPRRDATKRNHGAIHHGTESAGPDQPKEFCVSG